MNIIKNNTVDTKLISRLAFTLAEVLIVLGIVGTIAEMTIPTLVSDFEDKAAVSALKSEASSIQQAITMMQSNGESIDDIWSNSGNDPATALSKTHDALIKYLKVGNDWNLETGRLPSYIYLNKTSVPATTYDAYSKIQLIDGSILFFSFGSSPNIILYIDVNGLKAPNRFGCDVFFFLIPSQTLANSNNTYKSHILYPQGSTITLTCNPTGPTTSGSKPASGNGSLCTSWVYYQGNRDYLHCPSDLDWVTKTSCN